MSLQAFFDSTHSKFKAELAKNGVYITFWSSGQRGSAKSFAISLSSLLCTLRDILENIDEFGKEYEEKSWRKAAGNFFSDSVAKTLSGVQTKPLFALLNKIIAWANPTEYATASIDDHMFLLPKHLNNAIQKLEALIKQSEVATKTGLFRINPVLCEDKSLRTFAYNAFLKLLARYSEDACLANSTEASAQINKKKYTGLLLQEFGTAKIIAKFDIKPSEKSLSTSNALRFFVEPLPLKKTGYYYFSTQWVDDGSNNGLSFIQLKQYVERVSQGELTIVSGATYKLLHVEKTGQNIIIYGAPGTGKSFAANKFPNIVRTVFHSETFSHDFIGTYKPYIKNGNITYSFVPGPFAEALVMAYNTPSAMISLVIEEINRANAGAVFGEIFQLLDRKSDGVSEYPISVDQPFFDYLQEQIGLKENSVTLPRNLNIIATMNSADQGVFPLDSAFKRRWQFAYRRIDYSQLPKEYLTVRIRYNNESYSWSDFAQSINNQLGKLKINEDKFLGPFFLKASEFKNPEALASKLLLYLWDDVVRHHRNELFLPKYMQFSAVVDDFISGKPVFSFEFNDHALS